MGFNKSCNVNDYNLTKLKNNDTLYIKTDYLHNLSKIINDINCNFILVSGCSDYTIPNDIFNIDEFNNFISNNKIIHWFSQNCIYNHPKITNLPIGMDYHTLNENENFWGKMSLPIEQENCIINIKNNSKPFYERECKCYTTFHFSYRGYKYENDRINALINIPSNLVYYEPKLVTRNDSWINQTKYSFVISPHGNGLDCHRTWESLILGCIPIVKKSNIDALYEDLPVLIVDNWIDINQELLNNTINIFKYKVFNYDKLSLEYWVNKMKNNSY
jgi:hypothetical protein